MKQLNRLIASAATIAALTGVASAAAAAPPDAQTLLKQGYVQAKRQKKNVLVMFHASW